MSQEKTSFFSSLNPQTSFFLGLAASLLIVCTIGFFVLLAFAIKDDSQNNKPAAVNNNQPTAVVNSPSPAVAGKGNVQVLDTDHLRGNKNAPVKIVEYSDVQCPFCSRFHPVLQQVLAEYGSDVAWIYRHFPLDQLHPNARPGAEASECVYEQTGDEGFFAFIDGLFADQTNLGMPLYQKLASEIGVDLEQFNDCVATRKYQQKVENDLQQGGVLGVTGTPGSFINGSLVKGAVPYASLKQIIDSELSQ